MGSMLDGRKLANIHVLLRLPAALCLLTARDSLSRMADWENQSERTASVRVVFGVAGAIGLPLFEPRLRSYLPVLVGYLVLTLVFMALIRRRIGGVQRVAAGNMIDIAMLTFMVHLLGSTSTVVVTGYVANGVLNAISIPAPLPYVVAGAGVLAYGTLLTLEATHVLRHAPLLDLPPPTLSTVAFNASFLAILVLASTAATTSVARNLRIERRRNRELLAKLSVGRYRLERLIGRGGMGQVWEAVHLITGKRYALKFLAPGSADDTEARHRFIREARAASAVEHDNIINVVDVFEHEGVPVMVMDLLQGRTLRKHLDAAPDQRLTLEETANILLKVVAAVGAAHAAGVVHRDLKPENVFLCSRDGSFDVVKVLDFGIAKVTADARDGVTGALTMTGAVLGTPYYMSPEQAFGERDLDHRADIWAIGVMLYECLAGCRPIEGDNSGQIFKQLVSGALTPLRVLTPHLPSDILALADAMLARVPGDRLHDLRRAFDVLGQHATVTAPAFDAPGSAPRKRIDELVEHDVDATAETELYVS
jgi:eukaryotic-like serine/threonine-protein kinase